MRAIAAKTVVSLREKPTEQVCLDDELLYGMTAEILEEVPALQEGAFSEDIGDRKRRPVSEAEPDRACSRKHRNQMGTYPDGIPL